MTAEMIDDVNGIRRTRLESGLRVVTERLPHLRSAAVGFWVGTGARDESPDLSGASHFLEHLLFKGTDDRKAVEIAHAVESVGGDMNAFTGHEMTAFYVRVPDDRLLVALDILSAIVWTPALRADDVEAERKVILEELHMRDDAPDELVHDLFSSALYPGHPLGREVAGTRESIGAIGRDDIAAYHQLHYRPGNVVVAAAGNVDHDEVVERVAKHVAARRGDRPERQAAAHGVSPCRRVVLERPLEQVHLVVGTRALRRADPDRHALAVVNQAFGGGMSSRLFQEVRERLGLAYSVYSYRSAYQETGAFAVYCGTAPERLGQTLEVVHGELDRLQTRGLELSEIEAAKGHLVGSLALGLESSASRMHRLGRSELTLDEIPELDQLVAEIDAVTADDVQRVVERVLGTSSRTLAVVGPVDASSL